MAVHCVLERTLKGVLGHQSFRLSSREKVPLASADPVQVPEGGPGMRSESQTAVSSMGKKTLEGQRTKMACVYYVYLRLCPHPCLVGHAYCL